MSNTFSQHKIQRAIAKAGIAAAIRRSTGIFQLGKDVNLNEEPANDGTPESELMIAAFSGNIKNLRSVIEQHETLKLGVKTKDKLGRTALHWAIVGGAIGMVNHLIQAGADLRSL